MEYDEITRLVAKYLINNGLENAFKGLCIDKPGIETQTDVEGDLRKILEDLGSFMRKSKSIEQETRFTKFPSNSPKQIIPKDLSAFVVNLSFVGDFIAVSTANQKLLILTLDGELLHTIDNLHGRAAIRTIHEFLPKNRQEPLLLAGGLDGVVSISSIRGSKSTEFKAHSKFINSLDTFENYIVTSGYDKRVSVLHYVNEELIKKSELELKSLPTAVRFIKSSEPKILIGQQQSSKLFIYSIDLQELTSIDLWNAEFGSFGSVFCPMHLSLDKAGRRVAIATDHVPFMRIIIVDIETGEILTNMNSFSPQDQYSIPEIVWSCDELGIWAMGDDGKIRGIDISTGIKVVELEGHDERLRAIAISKDGTMISGGADKKVNLWKMR